MRTRVVAVDARAPDRSALGAAAAVLAAGGVVAFPTETFYGLGAAAGEGPGIRRVLALKERPPDKPLLVLVDSRAMAEALAREVPATAGLLMDRHWPGALTLVLPAGPAVAAAVTAGTGTVGVRLSAHPVARGLVEALGGPVTAPSANPAGAAAPVTAAEVLAYFEGAIDMILDGGPTPGGPPSTVLDITTDPPIVRRAGAVTV